MNLSRFYHPAVRRVLWASGAMSSLDKDYENFMKAKARMELDPNLHRRCVGHPLTRMEVEVLLTVVLGANAYLDGRDAMQMKARVGVRLMDAIKGMQSPRQTEGFTSDVKTVLEHWFERGVRERIPLDTFVETITSILANEQPNLGIVSTASWPSHNLMEGEEVRFVKVTVYGSPFAAAITDSNGESLTNSKRSNSVPLGDHGIIEKTAA